MVDNLDGDLAGLGSGEWSALGPVEAGPGVLVDLRREHPLELVLTLLLAGEVGAADEEALLIVISVTSPVAGNNVPTAKMSKFMRTRIHRNDIFYQCRTRAGRLVLGPLRVAGASWRIDTAR